MSYAKRIAYASFDATIAAIVFIITPLYILPIIEKYFGVNVPLYTLPYLGFMMVAASFFSGFSKKTRYEGAAVIVWSVVTIIYLSFLFWGGKFEISATTIAGETIYISAAFPIIFYLLLAIPAIGIARGAAMLHSYNNSKRQLHSLNSTEQKYNEDIRDDKENNMLPPHTD